MIPALLISIQALTGALVSLDTVYILTGVVLLIFSVMTFRDRGNPRRIGSALFWLTLGIVFILGSLLAYWLTGMLVLLMVGIDGAGGVRLGRYHETSRAEQAKEAARLGNRIFWPVLLIPMIVFGVALAFRVLHLDANKGALVGLGFGGIAAMIACMRLTGGSAAALMEEGRRLNDAMGTVSILPQLLASLGVVFTAARVGDLIAGGIQRMIPDNSLFLLVLANCVGMALFTIVMGNSFAAFPVIATGVLSPLIIQPLGVNPAMAAIITLTAGSSGTLVTPMAANFNIVPTALLNMRDQYGVIRFQLPYAVTIWSLHVVLMWLLIKLAL